MLFRKSCHCRFLKILTLILCFLVVFYLFKNKQSAEKQLFELEMQLSRMKEVMGPRPQSQDITRSKIEMPPPQMIQDTKSVHSKNL